MIMYVKRFEHLMRSVIIVNCSVGKSCEWLLGKHEMSVFRILALPNQLLRVLH